MNAEKLHIIACAIRDDLNKTQAQTTLNQLTQSLQSQISQPQQPEFQRNVSQHLSKLYDVLSKSASNEFSPAWKQLTKELKIEYLLGDNLADGLRGIFERNQITPSVALDEVKEMNDALTKLKQSIDKLIESLEALEIGKEELEPGECEIAVLIPRSAINEKFTNFTKELSVIDGIYGVFAEITTGKGCDFKIRSLSSSDPAVSIKMAIEIAVAVALAVNLIINSYKQIIEIRKYKSGMREYGVPSKSLSGVTSYANSIMKKGIDTLSKKIFKEYYKEKDKNRTPELDTALHFALNKMAKRIDKGYNFEIRVEPIAKDEERKKTSKSDQNARNMEYIRSTYEERLFIKTGGESLLSLPEAAVKRAKKSKGKKQSTPGGTGTK